VFQQACEVEIALQVWRFAGLAQIQQSGGSGGETGCGRGWGELILDRSLAGSLFANRFLGEFSRLNSSTFRASRVHVRAMSTKTSRTRALGARSANCWQSYERFLHIASARKRCGGTAFLGSTLLPERYGQ
jgi:hypothetical protein